ncbi:MAG: hypothetical protein Q9170_004898 [Blastenia crenularia]
MGLKGSSPEAKKSFSDDVLKIEVAGPSQQHLSVVDVPGIFRKVTEGVTTQEDIANVRAMVKRYMDNSRSVILAVVTANVDIANQEILDMAEVYDSDGQRTLGVLTKPDLVDEGAEGNVLDLMNGKAHKLKLGWSMVKNPGQADLARGESFDRQASEIAFFRNTMPWSTLDRDRVGVPALRLRLVELLTEIVRKEFNHVRTDVNQNLHADERRLKALGPCRETREQQQRYLLDLATQFQAMTTQVLDAHYSGHDAFDKVDSLRLATAVVNRNESFSNDVWHRGHTMVFKSKGEDHEDMSFSDEASSEHSKSHIAMSTTRYHASPDDVEDLLSPDEDLEAPGGGIMQWIGEVFNNARGFELGTFNASLIPTMWKKQSRKWDTLALGYTSDIISLTHNYIHDLLWEICEDERVRTGLLLTMMEELTDRYTKALDQTEFILQVERDPLTVNHYFAENLEKYNQRRMETLRDGAFHDENHDCEIIKLSDWRHNTTRMSNVEHTIQNLHDILRAYYKVARKRFVDNVCMQAAGYHLVRGPNTAVKVFSPAFVSDLTPEQLERIAGEDVSTKRKRAELTRQIENLKKAKHLLLVA